MSHILLARCEKTSKVDHFETHKLNFFQFLSVPYLQGQWEARSMVTCSGTGTTLSLFLVVTILNCFDLLFGIGLMTWKSHILCEKWKFFWVLNHKICVLSFLGLSYSDHPFFYPLWVLRSPNSRAARYSYLTFLFPNRDWQTCVKMGFSQGDLISGP